MNNCREEYVKIIEDCIGKLISDSEFDSEFGYLKNELGVIREDKDKKITLDTDFVNFIYECCLIKHDDEETLDDFLWWLIGNIGEVERNTYGFKAYYQKVITTKPFPAGEKYNPTFITYQSDVSGKVVYEYLTYQVDNLP